MRRWFASFSLSVLLLALQAAQPLLAGVPCDEGHASDPASCSCCCCESPQVDLEPPSCCGGPVEQGAEELGHDCGCAWVPPQPVSPSPVDLEGTRVVCEAVASTIPGVESPAHCARAVSAWPGRTVEPVAEGPPLRLWIQVFRL
ncbi:MAG: hypothetical protein CMJ94_07205 [Planctomycetes bacterium]|nr:hypothetical protein [Planctomycetota bacterium]